MRTRFSGLVDELCSPACAGRAPGTKGGIRARNLVRDALREMGLDPVEQHIHGSKGANLLATMKGDVDRWVLVAAHYDHLGETERSFFPGATTTRPRSRSCSRSRVVSRRSARTDAA